MGYQPIPEPPSLRHAYISQTYSCCKDRTSISVWHLLVLPLQVISNNVGF